MFAGGFLRESRRQGWDRFVRRAFGSCRMERDSARCGTAAIPSASDVSSGPPAHVPATAHETRNGREFRRSPTIGVWTAIGIVVALLCIGALVLGGVATRRAPPPPHPLKTRTTAQPRTNRRDMKVPLVRWWAVRLLPGKI